MRWKKKHTRALARRSAARDGGGRTQRGPNDATDEPWRRRPSLSTVCTITVRGTPARWPLRSPSSSCNDLLPLAGRRWPELIAQSFARTTEPPRPSALGLGRDGPRPREHLGLRAAGRAPHPAHRLGRRRCVPCPPPPAPGGGPPSREGGISRVVAPQAKGGTPRRTACAAPASGTGARNGLEPLGHRPRPPPLPCRPSLPTAGRREPHLPRRAAGTGGPPLPAPSPPRPARPARRGVARPMA